MPDTRSDAEHRERRDRPHPAEFPPRIIVQFNGERIEGDVLRYDYRSYLTNEELDRFEKQFPNLKIEQLFISFTAEDRMELGQEKKERNLDDKKRLLNLLTYFTIVCPKTVELTDVLTLLKEFRSFKQAYIAPVPETPAVTPENNPAWLKAETKFLRSAPDGIDMAYAWEIERTRRKKGGDGGGAYADLKFVDIEHGWKFDHKDIEDPVKRPNGIGIDGDNRGDLGHGTACLGIVIASDQEPADPSFKNSSLGITPNVNTVFCVSYFRNQSEATPNLYDAIFSAITYRLSSGDVLLLEVYFPSFPHPTNGTICYGVPIESEELLYGLIRMGTDRNIVIIEPAGNTDRNNDLDLLGIPQLRRGSGKDSGAIMVSAAHSSIPGAGKIPNAPMKDDAGNRKHSYGSRIDCFAWGEDIYTTWSGPSEPYAQFGDTSGAAAIIAGAALSIQGLAKINLDTFKPRELRKILSNPDPSTGGGTLSSNHRSDKIGVMPNLQNIIRKRLRLAP
jgi:hypothetical protein